MKYVDLLLFVAILAVLVIAGIAATPRYEDPNFIEMLPGKDAR